MLLSFMDELEKVAEGNVLSTAKPDVGGMSSNVIGKPLPTPGIAAGNTQLTPGPAKATNYTMVNATAPTAAQDAGASIKTVPPPSVNM